MAILLDAQDMPGPSSGTQFAAGGGSAEFYPNWGYRAPQATATLFWSSIAGSGHPRVTNAAGLGLASDPPLVRARGSAGIGNGARGVIPEWPIPQTWEADLNTRLYRLRYTFTCSIMGYAPSGGLFGPASIGIRDSALNLDTASSILGFELFCPFNSVRVWRLRSRLTNGGAITNHGDFGDAENPARVRIVYEEPPNAALRFYLDGAFLGVFTSFPTWQGATSDFGPSVDGRVMTADAHMTIDEIGSAPLGEP